MPSTITILTAIKSTARISWGQFIRNLPDPPAAFVDKSTWREILQSVGALESMELIVVERDRNSNEVLSLALTELGTERLRESIESDKLAIARRQRLIEADRIGRRRYV